MNINASNKNKFGNTFKSIFFSFILIASVLFSILPKCGYSQKETNIWYFGDSAGISFNVPNVLPINDGSLKTWEGVASLCDSLGNLILYTNGEKVWNKYGRVMKNGAGLHGSYTSTQSAIIVPKPASKDLFYIFTVDSQAQPQGYGLNYSLIDTKSQNYEGEVVSKNIFLKRPVPEKLTAIRHYNNKDIWVISHEWNTNNFISYLVTENGITDSVISSAGMVHSEPGDSRYNINSLGYMKASPIGDKIAVAHPEEAIVEVLNLDNSTGRISDGFEFNTGNWPYGIEFSPNGNFLYVSEETSIGQLDLTAGSVDQQIKSYTLIAESLKAANYNSDGTVKFEYGALQLASDGRIYAAVHGLTGYKPSQYLSVIQFPCNKGFSCAYRDSAVYLNGRICTLGLPNFIQSYFASPGFRWFSTCSGDATSFAVDQTLNFDHLSWDFGDIKSGMANTSTEIYPTHIFSGSGSYFVKLKFTYHSITDSITKQVSITNKNNVTLGSDLSKCKKDTIRLKATLPYSLYKWQDNSKDSTYLVTVGGVYSLLLTDQFGCSSQSQITIKDIANPKPDLGTDETVCEGTQVRLDPKLTDCFYLWQDNKTTATYLEPDTSGLYSVKATNKFGCTGIDSVKLTFNPVPRFDFGPDTVLCPEQRIRLSVPTYPNSHILWNTGNRLDHLDVMSPGTYWCSIKSDNGCECRDTIVFKSLALPVAKLGRDTFVCENTNLILNVGLQYHASYKWSDGTEDSKIIVSHDSKIWVEVKNICGSASDTIDVKFKYCGKIIVPNVITPNGDGVNDYLYVTGIEGERWQIYIYNRWGELIFNSSSYENNWPNKRISDGIYYYIMKNTEHDVESHGFFYVIR